MKNKPLLAVAALSLLIGLSGSASAQDIPDHRAVHPSVNGRAPHLQLDQRYNHNHYYPARGYETRVLPRGSISIGFGGGQFFFQGGVWFRALGGRFVVSVPPFGIVAPVLPPAYATLWIGGAPYYYANGVYYAAAPGQGYTVVAPPPGANEAQPVPVAPAPAAVPEPIIYPRSGQSATQIEADRQECNRWATTQPGAMGNATVFQRAIAACLDGRGYTVR